MNDAKLCMMYCGDDVCDCGIKDEILNKISHHIEPELVNAVLAMDDPTTIPELSEFDKGQLAIRALVGIQCQIEERACEQQSTDDMIKNVVHIVEKSLEQILPKN